MKVARGELLGLTGLRAWAALWVVAHHHRIFLDGVLGEYWLSVLVRGYLGVDLFFTLSGFVLAYNYGGRIRSAADHLRFILLRIARLYPLHLATLLTVIAVSQASGLIGLHISSPYVYVLDHHFFLHLFMIHGWGFESGLRFNRPSWSISAEFFAYLLFPLAWVVAVRFARPMAAAATALAVSGVTVLALSALGHTTLHVATQHALVRVSGEFLAGVLVYRCLALGGWLGREGALGAVPTAIALGCAFALAISPWADPWLAPGAALLVTVLATGRGPAMLAFASRPVVYLGRISYSIYLTHMLVMAALQRLLPTRHLEDLGGLQVSGVLVVHAVVIVGFAALSYRWIERPARDVLQRWVRRKLPAREGA